MVVWRLRFWGWGLELGRWGLVHVVLDQWCEAICGFLRSGLYIWTYNNNPGKETLHPRRYLMVALCWSISYNRCLVIARTNKILYWFFPNEFTYFIKLLTGWPLIARNSKKVCLLTLKLTSSIQKGNEHLIGPVNIFPTMQLITGITRNTQSKSWVCPGIPK